MSSCSWITGTDEEEYRIRVDSITAPASVRAVDTLRLVLHGVVGPDGCYRFDRIDERRLTNGVELAVWGIHETGSGLECLHVVVMLNEPYEVVPPLPDPFTVFVRQPDGSRLERSIAVERALPGRHRQESEVIGIGPGHAMVHRWVVPQWVSR